MVAGVIPAFTLGMGILFTWLYPLGRENHHDITRELEARRKAGKTEAETAQ
jgi:Na+/melibiose symporter-like transporter